MSSRGIIVSMLLGFFLFGPTLLLLVSKGLSRVSEGTHSYRTWTDNTGQFSARARLKSDFGNSVVLERQRDGEFVTVPVARFSSRDRRFLIYGEKGFCGLADLESEAPDLFPLSLGPWRFSHPRDLWNDIVDCTPLWVTLVIPPGIGLLGYVLFLRSRFSPA